MNSPEVPYKLSIIGYWSDPEEPPEWSRGLPDPRDLRGEWDGAKRHKVLSHLRRGKVFRTFMGLSQCRICGESLGCQELTDGQWAWPGGLEHYVEKHAVRLPEEFLEVSQDSKPYVPEWLNDLESELFLEGEHGSVMPADTDRESVWFVDDTAWLDWVAANTPARPANYPVSLEEAQLISQGLSHETWQARIEEVMGRWRLQVSYERVSGTIYLQKCPGRVLECRLLSLRVPDRNNILDASRANSIAKGYDGSWGAARILGVHPEAWYVWIKHPDGEWPESEQVNELLQGAPQLGWVTSHPDGATSFITPQTDEHCWRWLLICEQEHSKQRWNHDGRSEDRCS